MLKEDKYFRDLTEEELWRRYCGFFDLSLDEFMGIQKDLLMKEIDLVANSLLGRKIMGGKKPESVDEFRRLVRLTIYDDYEPYLSERREDALAVKPLDWCHSSGRGGKFKWLPYTSEAIETLYKPQVALIMLATATRKGEVKIKPGERLLLNVAPRPYTTGLFFYYFGQFFSLRPMPTESEGASMSFQERVQKGFQMALKNGVDEIFSLSSVLVKLGERMAEQTQGMKLSPSHVPTVSSVCVPAHA